MRKSNNLVSREDYKKVIKLLEEERNQRKCLFGNFEVWKRQADAKNEVLFIYIYIYILGDKEDKD